MGRFTLLILLPALIKAQGASDDVRGLLPKSRQEISESQYAAVEADLKLAMTQSEGQQRYGDRP